MKVLSQLVLEVALPATRGANGLDIAFSNLTDVCQPNYWIWLQI